MEPNPVVKFKSKFIAISITTVLFTFLTVVVKSSPIGFKNDILIEEDINKLENLLNTSQTDNAPRIKRGATANKDRLWDFGVIPYVIDESVGFTTIQKDGFRVAMDYWESVTCIKFVERNPNEHYNFIRFTVSTTCACCSFVGKQGYGGQIVSIGTGCHMQGTILHELGHAIGFEHEHQRPDRDEFIKIQSQYIVSGREYNLEKLTTKDVNSLGEPYDFDSIMHYAPNALSINIYDSTKSTIQAKRGNNGQIPNIGQRIRLSPSDIRQTNKLYKCPECGRTFHDQVATITPPNYPAKSDKLFRCEWRISVKQGQKIELNLFYLEIFDSINCENNYIEIRDGYWHKSPLLGRFCDANTNINAMVFKSTGNHITINYVTNSLGHRGFAIRYETFHDSVIPWTGVTVALATKTSGEFRQICLLKCGCFINEVMTPSTNIEWTDVIRSLVKHLDWLHGSRCEIHCGCGPKNWQS